MKLRISRFNCNESRSHRLPLNARILFHKTAKTRKNPIFAGFAVLYLTTLFRMLCGWGGRRDHVTLGFSALGFCLFLTNGLGAFLISLPIMVLMLRRFGIRVWLTLIAVAAFSCVFKFPVLKLAGIPQHNPFEALTIPVQQVARILHDGKEVSQEDLTLIRRLAPVEDIAQAYDPGYNDPVKWMINKRADQFVPRRGEYLSMWIRLGRRYPGKYFKAWIDQTRGYWNGGYNQWLFLAVQDSGFPGVRGTSADNRVLMGLIEYEQAFRAWPVLQLFLSIGLHVWIVSLLMFFSLALHRSAWILYVPVFAVFLTLLMAAPVFHDFRYAYPLFTCLPIFLFAPFCRDMKVSGTGGVS